MKPLVLGVVGATGSGKTGISLLLSRHLPIEIVCMDAFQIYRALDIGTAKPTREEQALVPHHMLDVAQPDQSYSVAEYAENARRAIDGILSRGRLPVLVGGTGLYLKALSFPMAFGGARSDPAVREKYEKLGEKIGLSALHALLREKDPLTAARLHPNDVRRVVRALEVIEKTGQPFSAQTMPEGAGDYRMLLFAPRMDRETLYARINRRVDEMMEAGLLDEVRGLLASGVPGDAQAMQGLGYKELIPALDGRQLLDEAVSFLKMRTRNYAKRQLTWFRADKRIHWLEGAREEAIRRMLSVYAEETHAPID